MILRGCIQSTLLSYNVKTTGYKVGLENYQPMRIDKKFGLYGDRDDSLKFKIVFLFGYLVVKMKSLLVLFAVACVAYGFETYLNEVEDFNDELGDQPQNVDMNLTAKKCQDNYVKCVNDSSWWAKIGGYKKCQSNVLWGCCNDLHHRCRAKAVNLKDFLKCQDEMFACKLPPKITKPKSN